MAADPEDTSPEADREPDDDRPHQALDFFIVGVGASAGGLEALSALIKNENFDNLAMVVIQHLSPTHESVLPTLLGRTSNVRVVAAEDGQPLEPRTIYVIPPNADLGVSHGVLQLIPPPARSGPRLPVDF